MRADKVLRAIIDRENLSATAVSLRIGKTRKYMSTLFSHERIPQADTMAGICDVVGYDLLVRSREDGYEITIDPPA